MLDFIWCHSLLNYPVDSEAKENELGGDMVICQRCEKTIVPPVKGQKKAIKLALCHTCQKVLAERKWKQDQKRYPF